MTAIAPSTVSTLTIVRLVLGAGELYRFANRTGLLHSRWGEQSRGDMGYIVHGALRASFGDAAPRPFYVLSNRERQALMRSGLDVADRFVTLGYTRATLDDLRTEDESRGTDIIDWNQTESKVMPTKFSPGKRLAFMVRVCPIVRSRIFQQNGRESCTEVDAYVAACEYHKQNGSGDPPNRMEVYHAWMLSKLTTAGVTVESLQMTGFHLADVSRRNAQRVLQFQRRPIVECQGIVSVLDTQRFESAIQAGIGRHRAFGFGMLRLSPA